MLKTNWLRTFAFLATKGFLKITSENSDCIGVSDLTLDRHGAKNLQSILANIIFKADYRLARPQYNDEVFYNPPYVNWS